MCIENNKDYSVCIVEKGSEVGAHILSGAILQPTAMDELFNDWRDNAECPVKVNVKKNRLNL